MHHAKGQSPFFGALTSTMPHFFDTSSTLLQSQCPIVCAVGVHVHDQCPLGVFISLLCVVNKWLAEIIYENPLHNKPCSLSNLSLSLSVCVAYMLHVCPYNVRPRSPHPPPPSFTTGPESSSAPPLARQRREKGDVGIGHPATATIAGATRTGPRADPRIRSREGIQA